MCATLFHSKDWWSGLGSLLLGHFLGGRPEYQGRISDSLDALVWGPQPRRVRSKGTCSRRLTPNIYWTMDLGVRGERDGLPTVSGEYIYVNGWSGPDYDSARQRIADQILKFHHMIAEQAK